MDIITDYTTTDRLPSWISKRYGWRDISEVQWSKLREELDQQQHFLADLSNFLISHMQF